MTTLAAFTGLDVAVQRLGEAAANRTAADKELFGKYRRLLPSGSTMRFLRDHDFGGEFPRDQLNPLYEFRDFCRQPDCKFLTRKLEKARRELERAVHEFLCIAATEIFPTAQPPWHGVPKEWLYGGPESQLFTRFQDAEAKLNEGVNRICRTYDNFIETGRRCLNVP